MATPDYIPGGRLAVYSDITVVVFNPRRACAARVIVVV